MSQFLLRSGAIGYALGVLLWSATFVTSLKALSVRAGDVLQGPLKFSEITELKSDGKREGVSGQMTLKEAQQTISTDWTKPK